MDQNLKVCFISAMNVKYIWDFVSTEIQRALSFANGKFRLEDVRRALLIGDMQLFVIVDQDDAIHAVIVTQIIEYPAKKVLFIMFVAGVEFKNWSGVLSHLISFARENSCSSIEGLGRKGWDKFIRPLGFIPIHTVYSLDIDEGTNHAGNLGLVL